MRLPILALVSLLGFLGASAAPGQLVHLALEAQATFEPGMSGATYALPKNALLKLDVFYETNLRRQNPDDTLAEFGGIYQPEPMSESVVRVRVADLSFYRSLTSIVVRPDRLEFEYVDDTGREFLKAQIAFRDVIAANYVLPVPPFPAVLPGHRQTGPVFFGGPNMFGGLNHPNESNWGCLSIGEFTSFSAELITPVTPVPEPGAGGAVAALGLAGLGLWQMRTARRRTQAPTD